ncbi:MAG: IS256 family transposase [Simkaniaceae bacterium]|nr:IS256 family transposase [Simkaniaceae bacterium]
MTHRLSATEQSILDALQSGKGLQDALAPMVKRVMEAALEGEMDQHLQDDFQSSNRRNGKSRKTVKSSSGAFELLTPRDRDGAFDPQIVKKRQTLLTDDLEHKIMNLYTNGMSYSDIRHNLEELYQVDIPAATITTITDRLLPELNEWKNRPLDSVYPILFLDAMHFKLRKEGHVVSKAIYTLLAINSEGKKDILGLYVDDTEGANFWASVLSSLKERGVEDILIACVDGLKGFPEAIRAIYPHTEVQLCIIHQIRNSMRYVASKDQKDFMRDLKKVYRASSRDIAEENLLDLEEKWRQKYPIVTDSWQRNWDEISAYFKYDPLLRKTIYTTNAVEGLHRQIRKYTKSKGAFTSQNALTKLVFAAYKKMIRKWNLQPVQNWAQIVSQLNIHFPKRLKLNIR